MTGLKKNNNYPSISLYEEMFFRALKKLSQHTNTTHKLTRPTTLYNLPHNLQHLLTSITFFFFSVFVFAQEQSVAFFVSPNTTISGIEKVVVFSNDSFIQTKLKSKDSLLQKESSEPTKPIALKIKSKPTRTQKKQIKQNLLAEKKFLPLTGSNAPIGYYFSRYEVLLVSAPTDFGIKKLDATTKSTSPYSFYILSLLKQKKSFDYFQPKTENLFLTLYFNRPPPKEGNRQKSKGNEETEMRKQQFAT